MLACRSNGSWNLGVLLMMAMSASLPLAANTIDFDDLPDAYFFSSGGQNVGSFYSGFNFGPYVTGLSVSRFGGYDNSAFPPHSGDVAVWSPYDDPMTVTFSSPEAMVDFWYTSLNPITITAYDAANSPIGTVTGNANSDGTSGTSSYLEFVGANIASVDISSAAGQYVIDDFSANEGGSAVSEPSSLLLLTAGMGAFVLVFRRSTVCAITT